MNKPVASRGCGLAAIVLVLLLGWGKLAEASPRIILVVGAEGAPEYGQQFKAWAQRWKDVAQRCGATLTTIAEASNDGLSPYHQLERVLGDEPKQSEQVLWLVLIGHGTYDQHTARFNLQGPDVAANELAVWLEPFQRPTILINCASSSAPFLNLLSRPDRVVITATKSGFEHNFARFGEYFAQAVDDPTADYDKDGQTSLLEAFLAASRRAEEFYKTDGRLATEHALIDDNGDQLGTPADWFRGVRAIKKAKDGATLDGNRAHQFVLVPSEREKNIPEELRAERNKLELQVAQLRERRDEFELDEYYSQLETILLELAEVHDRIEQHLKVIETQAAQIKGSSAPNDPVARQ